MLLWCGWFATTATAAAQPSATEPQPPTDPGSGDADVAEPSPDPDGGEVDPDPAPDPDSGPETPAPNEETSAGPADEDVAPQEPPSTDETAPDGDVPEVDGDAPNPSDPADPADPADPGPGPGPGPEPETPAPGDTEPAPGDTDVPVGEPLTPPGEPGADPTTQEPPIGDIPPEGLTDEEDARTQVDLADPLGPIDAALDGLAAQGFIITTRRREQRALQGEVLSATLSGPDSDLLVYVMRRVADNGYQIQLAPAGKNAFTLLALRAKAGQGRGVDFVNIDEVRVTGSFRRGESAETLRKFAAVPPGGVVPAELTEEFQRVGYKATFTPVGAGRLVLEVRPGRSIRGVKVRGHRPISDRIVRRVLSVAARPGSLARGQCVDRKTLRNEKTRPKSVCGADDKACAQWEQDEIDRLHRFLHDNGYIEGRAALGLRCGKDGEAYLHVFLDKGRAFRMGHCLQAASISQCRPKITGNVTSEDQRWIRRMFRPTISPFVPIPKRVTRKHLEAAKEKVAAEYATPRSATGAGGRRQLELPYPGIRIETNYEQIGPKDLPTKGRELPLVIDIQLGHGVQTGFKGNDHVSNGRLLSHLQLFKRQEPATAAAAVREAENLRGFYQGRGFMLARVEGRFDDFSTLKQLFFSIDEGPRVRVRDVDFPELPDVEPGVRRGVKRAWTRDRQIKKRSRFTDAGARGDLALILQEFAARGYLCARAQVRVAFWKDGLDTPGANAVIDVFSELAAPGTPSWLEQQLDPAGLEALRKQGRAGLYARLEILPGPRVVTSPTETIQYLEIPIPPSRDIAGLPAGPSGNWGATRMLRDGPLRRKNDKRVGGIPLRLDLDRDAERTLASKYRLSGYPVADAEVRWVYTDGSGVAHVVTQAERLTNPDVGMCREQQNADSVTIDTQLAVYEGRRGTFGTTLIRGNFKTKRYVLNGVKAPGKDNPRRFWSQIEWSEGDDYSRRRVDETRKNIEGVGVVDSVQIREQPQDCDLTDDPDSQCVVHEVVAMTESKDRLMDLSWGFGAATLDPLYGFIRPSFPNVGGSGWDINLDAHVGANFAGLNETFCSGEDCYERSGRVNILRPRIWGTPLTFDIGTQVQRRVTPARGQIDSLLGQIRLVWPVSDHWRTYVGYLVQAANISKGVVKPTLGAETGCGSSGDLPCRPPDRSEAIVPDLTGGFEIGATWQRVDNAFNPEDGFIATGDTLIVPTWPGGNAWIRNELSWQHFIPIRRAGNRFNLRYMLRYGHAIPISGVAGATTQSIPEVWRFFGGGTADLGIRGIEPQTMLSDTEEIETPYGVVVLRPTAIGGHIRALGTVALQVVSVPSLLGGKLAHSVFLDVGVLAQRWRHVVPLRDIRRSVGVNFIKWDIRIVTVALGYAILVPNSILPRNVRPTDDRNGRFVFDVGATF